MKRFFGTALLLAGASAQASHWVPVTTRPDADPTGLYIDKESLKGTFPLRTVREKFVNSYREERLSVVEMNCAKGTWRALAVVLRSPNGAVLQSAKYPNTKSQPIASDPSQKSARRLVCGTAEARLKRRHGAAHR